MVALSLLFYLFDVLFLILFFNFEKVQVPEYRNEKNGCLDYFSGLFEKMQTRPTLLKYARDWIRVNRLNNGAVRYPSDRDAYF